MKTVLFLRHGKSDWQSEFDRDHDRPLAKRGRKAAATMGRLLAATDLVPDRVYTSSALRARDTVARAAKAGGWGCPIDVTAALYEASSEQTVDVIRRADAACDRILLAGHEPTWSDVTGMLVGGANIRFPTAAIARIDFAATSWTDVQFGGGTLVWFLPPRLVAGFDSLA